MGDLGHSQWRCTGLRWPEHLKERAREVSESPAESARLPVRRSPPRSLLTPGSDILQRRLHGPPELNATAERCGAGACQEQQREVVRRLVKDRAH